MGLKEDLRSIPGRIFDALGNVAEKVTYERETKGPVDPVTGQTVTVTSKQVRAVFLTFSEQRVAVGDIKAGDIRMVVPAGELGFQPQAQDNVVRGGGRYTVIAYETDPVQAHYSIQVRKS
ncbi:hypothetical protein Sp245p_28900 (plasmid) [Azospirillum baldaniorum]|uniref:Phage protein n=1 Tax=Azospirillum baldaniorum TaxID=1064539 RepID=A0A9P1NQH4_9PROT|nr:hypothetical protein [Azospirillum baldaniorum]AWJ93841.1 hypothetical protein Sp245p_28900 [Azospirillum baldaniorum]TWA81665.1 hypothetical protein FBZ85_10239 [Azospirillum brasilense]CCD02001.1 protein of unknown function [Azospirillum baldaniorum]